MEAPLDITGPIIIGMAVLFAILGVAHSLDGHSRRGRWSYGRPQWRPRLVHDRDAVPPSRMPDAADQLRAVENASYDAQPLLRFQEQKVFAAAEAAVAEAGVPWRVFAQVSLGEVLRCEDREGFNAINAKRVDFLIADARFQPLAAIEYQGGGHYLGKAAARDAVKKEALRKAGIAYIEMTADHGVADLRREIGRLAFAKTRPPSDTVRKFSGG